jgi:hypothetical protein
VFYPRAGVTSDVFARERSLARASAALPARAPRPRFHHPGGWSWARSLTSCTCARNDRAVIPTDTARFAVDDADPLVIASFACPYCLGPPTRAVFSFEEPAGSALLCSCDDCRASWIVIVNRGQALRLSLAPPSGLELEAA